MKDETKETGTAPAVAPAPPSAAASESSLAVDGAAPALTPYQRRKQREREEKAKAEARRAKRNAASTEKATKRGPSPASSASSTGDAGEADEEWNEEQRKREAGGFWRLTLRVVSLCMWPFGYRLEELSEKEVADDVALLAPLAVRHKWLEVLIRYAALPYLLVERIVVKAKKREEKKPAPAEATK